jgi:hypothetical protein
VGYVFVFFGYIFTKEVYYPERIGVNFFGKGYNLGRKAMCNHLWGRINPRTHRQTCIVCHESRGLPADLLATQSPIGILERYSAGLFSQWVHADIREFLHMGPNDQLLHSWADNYLYVFRSSQV